MTISDDGNRNTPYHKLEWIHFAIQEAKNGNIEELNRALPLVEDLREDLFWLTNTMDDSQQKDTDKLKQRAVHPSIADFVQRLAEWGFNNCDNGYVWEAMCAVIEAGERGDINDLIACYTDDGGEEE